MEKNDIIIIHGTNYKEMSMQVLEKAGLADLIGSRDKSVALKPNLVQTLEGTPAIVHPQRASGRRYRISSGS